MDQFQHLSVLQPQLPLAFLGQLTIGKLRLLFLRHPLNFHERHLVEDVLVRCPSLSTCLRRVLMGQDCSCTSIEWKAHKRGSELSLKMLPQLVSIPWLSHTMLACASNPASLSDLFIYLSRSPVASVVISVRDIVCFTSSVSFSNHRPCVERYRVCRLRPLFRSGSHCWTLNSFFFFFRQEICRCSESFWAKLQRVCDAAKQLSSNFSWPSEGVQSCSDVCASSGSW